MTPLRISGGDALVRALVAHGTELVFGIPGTHNLGIYRYLAEHDVRHVTPRHEQGAGFAADGKGTFSGVWARQSQPGSHEARRTPATTLPQTRQNPRRRLAPGAIVAGVMFTLPELATAAQERLALPVIICDNGGYGEIRREMADRSDLVHGVDLPGVDFARVAKGLNCHDLAGA